MPVYLLLLVLLLLLQARRAASYSLLSLWKSGKYRTVRQQLPAIHHLSITGIDSCHVVGPSLNATVDLCTGSIISNAPLAMMMKKKQSPPLLRPRYGPRSVWGYTPQGRGVVITPDPFRVHDLPESCHLASSSCEKYHVTLTTSNTMIVIDLETQESRIVDLPTTCLCLYLRRDTAYLGSIDGDVYVYRMLTSEFLAVRLPYNPSPIRCIKVSSEGNSVFEQMVLGCQDGQVRVARWYYPTPVGSVDEHTVTCTRWPHDSPVLDMAIDEHRCVTYSEPTGVGSSASVLSFGSATENWFRVNVQEKVETMALNDRFLVIASAETGPRSCSLTIFDFYAPGKGWNLLDDAVGDGRSGGGGMIVLK